MAGSSRACGNTEEKIRNDEELSKASALRELEKARVRECQMEKTVRWWTVCTAGWRKKWSKLRQENEELRKQIKTHKTQLNGITQDCAALNNKLEFFNAHNSFLKCEINKLILKYGDEVDEHIREILNSPDIIKPKMYICSDCKVNKDEAKSIEKSLTTPEAGGGHETKNVEVLTDMISKIFAELQNLKGEFVKQNEGPDYKDLLEFPMSPDQITQLKIYSLNKQLEKERLENKDLLKKLEQANTEISMLNGKLEEITVGEFLLDPEPKMPDSLSDEE